MIVFGSRTIHAHTTGKSKDFECVTEAYLKEISSEYCSDEEIKARAKEAYNNVYSLSHWTPRPSAVPDKDQQVRQPISSGVSNNFDNLGLCEMPQIDTSSFNVSLSTLGSSGRARMQDSDALNVSSDRDIHDPQSEYRTSNFSLSDEVSSEVSGVSGCCDRAYIQI
ncbi:hypothetical protein INT47_004708 [Mucor saturninus]|uniref:Uncharacterized protein n=1 Tax=Mucor saturninus TaxID=64648 RepID=A0A8H7UMP7_9FUNG|nr:hypothetical protein INT47_004708 [Mucor saturninus]